MQSLCHLQSTKHQMPTFLECCDIRRQAYTVLQAAVGINYQTTHKHKSAGQQQGTETITRLPMLPRHTLRANSSGPSV